METTSDFLAPGGSHACAIWGFITGEEGEGPYTWGNQHKVGVRVSDDGQEAFAFDPHPRWNCGKREAILYFAFIFRIPFYIKLLSFSSLLWFQYDFIVIRVWFHCDSILSLLLFCFSLGFHSSKMSLSLSLDVVSFAFRKYTAHYIMEQLLLLLLQRQNVQ